MKVLAALLAISPSLPLVASQRTTDKCSPVHIFLSRGNNEPYPGRQGNLVEAICSGLKDGQCDYEDFDFYNPLEAPYCESVEEGAINGAKQIKAYNKRCPESKLVVSGYSQGGQVVGDVLGGGGGIFFQGCVQKPNPALDPESDAGKAIVAALIFGDTRHTAGQTYNDGSGADKNGLFPRPGDQLDGLNAYASVLRNFCVAGDPICAQGKTVGDHLNYFDKYSDETGRWVRQMIAQASGGNGGSDKTTTLTTVISSSKTASGGEEGTSTEVSESTSEAESGSKTESSARSTAASESASSSDSSEDRASSSASPSETSSEDDEGSDGDDEDAAGALVPSFVVMSLGFLAAVA